MLPINLLPNYIHDRGKKPKMVAVYVGVIAAIIIGAVVYANGIQSEVDKAKTDLATATQKQTTYNAKVTEIKKVQGDIAEIGTKQTFIANAQAYNQSWPDTYELMRDLTSKDVLLKSMAISPTDRKTVTMAAFAANEMIIARWWIDLKNHKEIFDNVTMQLPTHPWAPAGANGPGGAPGGGFGGSGGFPGSGGPGPGAAVGMNSSGAVGGFPASGGASGSGGFPGSGGGGGSAAEGVGPTEIEGRSGVNFSVRAILKTALAGGVTAPTWTGGGAAPAPAGGGFGGSGGGAVSGGPSSGGTPSSAGRD